jgi:glutamine synthetase
MLEVAVAAADPLVAADRAVLVRLLINRVAARHGHQATFAPITGFGQLGSGCHAHLSLYSGGVNQLTAGDREYGITRQGESAFAGVLHHLPGMIAILAASPLSYQRLAPGNWSGAHVCWGRENRQAALRFVPGTIGIRQDAANFEVKSGDNTANPYLAAAALIAASQDGLSRGLELPPPTEDDPATLSDAERRRCDVRRLPESLDRAISSLERNDVLRKAFGDALMDCYLAVRRGEAELAGTMTHEQLVLRLRDRYC